MSALELTPSGTEYLRTDIQYQQLSQNKKDLTLATNIIAGDVTPKLVLDGSGRANLEGQVVIDTATVGNNMELASLPSYIVPQTDSYYPITVLRSNVPVTNYLTIYGAGGSGEVIGVDITNPGSYAGSIPTFSTSGPGTGFTGTVHVKALSTTVANSGDASSSYAPGNTITLAGGTNSTAVVLTVVTTRLLAAAISVPGSGGADGPVVLIGTTGTGTKYTINGTISGGALTSIGSIVTPGSYTANPNTISDPVDGGGLSGAALTLRMGVLTTNILIAGNYTAVPSNPVSQASSSGFGTGAQFNVNWSLINLFVTSAGAGYTSDSTITFSAGAVTATGTLLLNEDLNSKVILMSQPQQNDVICLDGCSFLTNSY